MFTFNIDKLIHSVIFFVNQTAPDRLGKVKLMKLLYYSDFWHMRDYGRPIIGDTYCKLENGPVPFFTLNLISEAETCVNDQPDEEDLADTNTYVQKLKEAIGISLENYYGKKKLKFNPRIEFDSKIFSKSDLTIMKKVADEFYHDNGKEISEKTHKERGWELSELFGSIDYRYALDPDSIDYFNYWEKTLESFRTLLISSKTKESFA
ncbi:MAG TPA: DUF4065 domain-containing protein [Nitrospirae bacterium]|nr:hypothetical protein BMS3Abin10_01018 [bacterium BMS3Abin10]HDO26078.1 DUF4065 domain-containing protein [Nitrospirota bacterium]